MYSDYKLTSRKHTHIDDVTNLSCVCGSINCCCCTENNRNRYTPAGIQEQFDKLTDVNSLKKNQTPHAKVCLEEQQFARPSPALRYAKLPRRKLASAPEPMIFGLPIQYDSDSIERKKLSIDKLCTWPFIGLSEYLRSYRPYNVCEIQSHRGKALLNEERFSIKDLVPMARFTTYRKDYQDPRSFNEKTDYDSNLPQLYRC